MVSRYYNSYSNDYDSDYENSYYDNDYYNDEGVCNTEESKSGRYDEEQDESLDVECDDIIDGKDVEAILDSSAKKKFYEYDFNKIMEDYRSGDPIRVAQSKEDAILALEGVVRSIIKRRYSTYTGKHYYDLDQSGKLGIMKAMERFEPGRGAASTFFYSYIVHEMQTYIDSFINRTTPHYSANIRKIKRAISVIQKKKDDYTAVDIAQETGLTMETIEQALSILNCSNEVHYDNCTDAFLNDNIDLSQHSASPETECMRQEQESAITGALTTLPEFQRQVITMSFGIATGKEMSYKEISRQLNNAPIDKIKKAYADGLRNLRRSRLKDHFHDYIESEERQIRNNEITMTGIGNIFETISDDVADIEGDFTDC